MLNRVGLDSGSYCLEVGAGNGSIAQYMAKRSGADGKVWAVDIDLRFMDTLISDPPKGLQVLKRDVLKDDLPDKYFDIAHARAVLEHLSDPQKALQRMRASLKPGGWLVIEGSEFSSFDSQGARGAFAELIRIIRDSRTGNPDAHKAHLSLNMLTMFEDVDLVNIDMRGHIWPMRGGQPSIEWLLIALEWGMKDVIDPQLLKEALAQARREDFVAFSPLHVSVWGQVPA